MFSGLAEAASSCDTIHSCGGILNGERVDNEVIAAGKIGVMNGSYTETCIALRVLLKEICHWAGRRPCSRTGGKSEGVAHCPQ